MGRALWAGTERVRCVNGLHSSTGLDDLGFFRLAFTIINYPKNKQGGPEKETEIRERLEPADLLPFRQKNKPGTEQEQDKQRKNDGRFQCRSPTGSAGRAAHVWLEVTFAPFGAGLRGRARRRHRLGKGIALFALIGFGLFLLGLNPGGSRPGPNDHPQAEPGSLPKKWPGFYQAKPLPHE